MTRVSGDGVARPAQALDRAPPLPLELTLIACGPYLVMALEAGGSRRRSTLVAAMCAVMGGLYVTALAIPGTRAFFALTVPHADMLATALLASAASVAALWIAGFSLRPQQCGLAYLLRNK